MNQVVAVEEISKRSNALLIDVRTSSEYQKGTIPGAINLPLFDEVERKEIGLLYKLVGPVQAYMKGLALASPKLTCLAEILQPYYDKELILFCWRGGLRSQALTSVLNLIGFKVFYLIGGYKAYRRFIISYLSEYEYKQRFVVLEGLTGVGKTEVIAALRDMKEPAIDLETLAGHRGSVFGHIGLAKARSQKDFEALLVRELQYFKDQEYVIIECESRCIGPILLPERFFEAMKQATKILLYDNYEHRIQRILKTYLTSNQTNPLLLEEAVFNLQKRLGKQKTAFLLDYLHKGNSWAAVDFLLREYYDPVYHFPSSPCQIYDLSVCSRDPLEAAQKIKNYLKSLFV